jgi:hypothetical protein
LVLNVDDLLEICIAARARGMDFPTLWKTILKTSRLVVGNPVQMHAGGKPALKIRLVTNQHLLYGEDRFSLEAAPSQRLASGAAGRPRTVG